MSLVPNKGPGSFTIGLLVLPGSRQCAGDDDVPRPLALLEDAWLVTDSWGYAVYSGNYDGVFMTARGTEMSEPMVAIALGRRRIIQF